jgi:hypothetical protein
LETRVANQNLFQEKIKSGFNSDNACYHSIQYLLPSRLPSKSLKMLLHKIIILHVVLYGCETCSLTLRKEHSLRVFEKKVLRRIFGPMGDDLMGG